MSRSLPGGLRTTGRHRRVVSHLLVDRHHDSVELGAACVRILLASALLRAFPRDLIFRGLDYAHWHPLGPLAAKAASMPSRQFILWGPNVHFAHAAKARWDIRRRLI